MFLIVRHHHHHRRKDRPSVGTCLHSLLRDRYYLESSALKGKETPLAPKASWHGWRKADCGTVGRCLCSSCRVVLSPLSDHRTAERNARPACPGFLVSGLAPLLILVRSSLRASPSCYSPVPVPHCSRDGSVVSWFRRAAAAGINVLAVSIPDGSSRWQSAACARAVSAIPLLW